MGDVVEFPTESRKITELTEKLEKGVTDLEFKYNELDTIHDMLHTREEEAGQLEKDYDMLIKEYIDIVGIKDTPALWLTYSRSCVVKATAEGEYEMIWLGTDLDD